MNHSNKINTYLLFIISAMISILLGFLRESIIAYKFGTGWEIDSLVISLIIPLNIFASVFEAMSLTLIPILKDLITSKFGKKNLYNFILILVPFLILTTLGISLITFLSSFKISHLLKGSMEYRDELAQLISISSTLIIFSGMSAIAVSILNMNEKYQYTAKMQLVYNISIIISLLYFIDRYGILGAALSYVIGEFVKMVYLLIGIVKSRLIYFGALSDFKFPRKYLREFVIMLIPLLIGIAFTELKNVIDRMYAAKLQVGSVGALNYALKLYILPIGVLISGITTISYVDLTNNIVRGEKDKFLNNINIVLKTSSVLILPVSLIMVFCSDEIIRIAYQRGEFSPHDTKVVSTIFKWFSIGTLFYVWRHLLNRVFWSMRDSKIPLVGNLLFFTTGTLIVIATYKVWGVNGIALSTSVSLFCTSFFLLYKIKQAYSSYPINDLLKYISKLLISLFIMYVVLLGLDNVNLFQHLKSGMLKDLLIVFFNSIVGGLIFLLISYILKIEEVNKLLKKIKNLFHNVFRRE